MKIIDYLQAKYKQAYPTTCLLIEAKIFGIPYPLESGWLQKFSRVEITPTQLEVLKIALEKFVATKRPNWEWAQSGLNALDRAHVIERSVEIVSQGMPFSTNDWSHKIKAIYALNKGICHVCKCKPETYQVKHKVLIPALFLDYDNLVLLCKSCAADWQATPTKHKLSKYRDETPNVFAKRYLHPPRIGYMLYSHASRS